MPTKSIKPLKAVPLSNPAIDEGADQPSQSKVSQAVTKLVNQEVLRLDPFECRLNEIKEKYSGLTIVDADDVDGFEVVRLAVGDMRGIRNRSKDEADAAKQPLTDGIKFINEKLAMIVDGVWEVEEPLSIRLKEVKVELEKIKADKKRQKDEQYIRRTQELFSFGAKYDADGNFVLNDVTFDAATIRETDESLWLSDIKPEYQKIFDAAQAEKVAAQKLIDDQAIALKKQQDDFAETQRLFKEQVAALQTQKDELAKQTTKAAEDKRKSIVSGRVNLLQALGMVYNFNKRVHEFGSIFIDADEAGKELTSDEVFNTRLTDITAQVTAAKAVIEEQKKKDADAELLRQQKLVTGRHRYDLLAAINVSGNTIDYLGSLDVKAWDILYKDFKDAYDASQKEIADKKKQDDLDASNDKTKWAAVIAAINTLPIPDMKNATYKAKIQSLKNYLEKIKSL